MRGSYSAAVLLTTRFLSENCSKGSASTDWESEIAFPCFCLYDSSLSWSCCLFVVSKRCCHGRCSSAASVLHNYFYFRLISAAPNSVVCHGLRTDSWQSQCSYFSEARWRSCSLVSWPPRRIWREMCHPLAPFNYLACVSSWFLVGRRPKRAMPCFGQIQWANSAFKPCLLANRTELRSFGGGYCLRIAGKSHACVIQAFVWDTGLCGALVATTVQV